MVHQKPSINEFLWEQIKYETLGGTIWNSMPHLGESIWNRMLNLDGTIQNRMPHLGGNIENYCLAKC